VQRGRLQAPVIQRQTVPPAPTALRLRAPTPAHWTMRSTGL